MDPRKPKPTRHKNEALALAHVLAKWIALGAWVGLLAGVASALFLDSLEWATETRKAHPYFLYFLPLVGLFISVVYTRHGKKVAGGNNLLLDRVHDPAGGVPFRMAPMILISTVLTHLFGGSAGREGTAIQMGGTLADVAVKPLRLSPGDRRILIITGMAAGFGSVFGVPLAGAVFGLEVLAVGRIRYDALVPCVTASLVGDIVCRGLGIHHLVPVAAKSYHQSPLLWLLIVLAGCAFAIASIAFSELAHAIQNFKKGEKEVAYLRPIIGGAVVVGLTLLVGNQRYNGLSIGLIMDSFQSGQVPLFAFALKILFTAVTLGTGFKGGEVTPLLCIGATLGNAFAAVTHQDPALFAALGFVAVFAGAANTPLACTLMGIELFGAHLAMPLLVVCVLSYILSGHRGIYLSQLVDQPKNPTDAVKEGATLRTVRSDRIAMGKAFRPDDGPLESNVTGSP